jgi:hypothetical protein
MGRRGGAEYVWAVIYTERGGLAGVYTRYEDAARFAYVTESLLVRLPIWADMRREEDRKGWEHRGSE